MLLKLSWCQALTWQDKAEDAGSQQLRVGLAALLVASQGDVEALQPLLLLCQGMQALPGASAVLRLPLLPHVPPEEGQQPALPLRRPQHRRVLNVWRRLECWDHQILQTSF